jgi:hypothetical protein
VQIADHYHASFESVTEADLFIMQRNRQKK